jgi:ribosome maturation factor RimP
MSVKKSGNTVDKVYELAKPLADEIGVDIWDIRFEKEGSNWYLRVFIDKEGGVFIEDCEALSRPLNKLLDETDPISQSYIFEVCSTGLGRELKKPEHFEKFIGSEVKVRLIRAVDNIKEFIGILLEYNKDAITLQLDEETTGEFKLSECAYVKLNDDDDLFN